MSGSHKQLIDTLFGVAPNLTIEDQTFALSLCKQWFAKKSLSDKQWYWVGKLLTKAELVAAGVESTATEALALGNIQTVYEMFSTAAATLKYPKIRLGVIVDGVSRPIALSVAGPKSKRAGHINVTNGGSYYYSVWLGSIDPDGNWHPSREVADDMLIPIVQLLEQLAKDPVSTMADYGKLTGHCSFCYSELSDPKSKAVGYGPVCAKKWGLPWG